MRELRPSLWHRRAPHPDCTADEIDDLADFGGDLGIQAEWLWGEVTREQVAGGLSPPLELPVELVLRAHGEPADRSALERALA